jgi:hypothetical protein
MIAYRKKFLRIVECWNGEENDRQRFDLERYFQQSKPREGMLCRPFYTVLLDLNQSNESLLAAMRRVTRYEIRRAGAKDQLVYQFGNGVDVRVFTQFCEYYDEFAAQKQQPKLDRGWLSLLAKAERLHLTQVSDSSGETLVWHGYLRYPKRVTLLYSASLIRNNRGSAYKNIVARANRYHHWQDMMRFKLEGISTYDFGGWYEGTADQERLKINWFKEQFGGEIVKNYICERAVTLRGKLFLRARQFLLGNAI